MNINFIILNPDLIASLGVFLLTAIIGVTSIIKPIRISNPLIRTFATIMVASSLIFLLFNIGFDFSKFVSISLIIIYFLFNLVIYLLLNKNSNFTSELFESLKFLNIKSQHLRSFLIILLVILIKLVFTFLILIISDSIHSKCSNLLFMILLLIPELLILGYLVSKNDGEILVFYIFNSIIFNNLFLFGYSIYHFPIGAFHVVYSNGLMLLISTLVFYPLTKSGNTIGRKEGLILIFFCAV